VTPEELVKRIEKRKKEIESLRVYAGSDEGRGLYFHVVMFNYGHVSLVTR
jgi:hypothetical protein